jgi:hypothetical protein
MGSVLNWGLIKVGELLIPLPSGADVSTPEGLKAAIPLFEFKHFLFPLIAHALGTLFGAFVAVRLSGIGSVRPAMVVAAFFLIGGAAMIMELPAPMWFNITDLVVAYIPMGLLGYRLAKRNIPDQGA